MSRNASKTLFPQENGEVVILRGAAPVGGYLMKLSTKNKWQKRYYEVRGSYLMYWGSESQRDKGVKKGNTVSKPNQSVDLRRIKNCTIDDSVLMLSSIGGNIIRLKSCTGNDDFRELMEWQSKINDIKTASFRETSASDANLKTLETMDQIHENNDDDEEFGDSDDQKEDISSRFLASRSGINDDNDISSSSPPPPPPPLPAQSNRSNSKFSFRTSTVKSKPVTNVMLSETHFVDEIENKEDEKPWFVDNDEDGNNEHEIQNNLDHQSTRQSVTFDESKPMEELKTETKEDDNQSEVATNDDLPSNPASRRMTIHQEESFGLFSVGTLAYTAIADIGGGMVDGVFGVIDYTTSTEPEATEQPKPEPAESSFPDLSSWSPF